ncbi:MAG: response regulator [Lachnospiraceae bacterium]|nr:response regulator [Lachnospiraceae bacterium]
MDKILLTGERDENTSNINGYLSGIYSVQLCSKHPEDIKAIIQIAKPGLVIICNARGNDNEIIGWIKENYPELPVLAITTTDGWNECMDYLQGEQYDKLFLPASKDDFLGKCRQMLKKDAIKDTDAIKNTADDSSSNGNKKILIVDDSPLILRNIKNLLENEYDVITATSGQQALDIIVEEKPGLVLLDYEMPKMSGKTVFETIKKNKDIKDTPVIFLTGVSNKKIIYSILQLNPADYILKPPDTQKLLNTIKKILKG